MNLLLYLALIGSAFISTESLVAKTDTSVPPCRYSRVHSLLQATCHDLKLKEIPKHLLTNIEVLDARDNKIRRLKNDSLSKYPRLAYLHLQENVIQEIAEAAFTSSPNLQVVDLSLNGLHYLPKNLFELRFLNTLYLVENSLKDSCFEDVHVRSPLVFLQVSGNLLTKIPELRPLTSLKKLDVSYNVINHISVEEIADLCSLEVLDLTGNPIKFDEFSCDCHAFETWTELRNIAVRPSFHCPMELDEECLPIEYTNKTLHLFSSCGKSPSTIRAHLKLEMNMMTWIAIGVVAVVSGTIATCCLIRSNNKSRKKARRNRRSKGSTNSDVTCQTEVSRQRI